MRRFGYSRVRCFFAGLGCAIAGVFFLACGLLALNGRSSSYVTAMILTFIVAFFGMRALFSWVLRHFGVSHFTKGGPSFVLMTMIWAFVVTVGFLLLALVGIGEIAGFLILGLALCTISFLLSTLLAKGSAEFRAAKKW